MSRIRTIKPEFWTSEQVMECSPIARLLFIGLWNFCDDAGRGSVSAKRIKAQIFPGDDISSEIILGMLDELSRHNLIRFYSVDDKDYFHVTGWGHQRIDKRQPPKFPDPPDDSVRSVAEHSANDPGMVATDLKGREGIGKEQTLSAEDADGVPEEGSPTNEEKPSIAYPSAFDELWREYQAGVHERNSSKADAYKAWKKLSPADRDACWEGVISYGQAITEARKTRAETPAKHLSRFINARAWEPYMEAAE